MLGKARVLFMILVFVATSSQVSTSSSQPNSRIKVSDQGSISERKAKNTAIVLEVLNRMNDSLRTRLDVVQRKVAVQVKTIAYLAKKKRKQDRAKALAGSTEIDTTSHKVLFELTMLTEVDTLSESQFFFPEQKKEGLLRKILNKHTRKLEK